MKVATLLFLIRPETEEVLLGLKKVRFGAGKFNGFGGHVEDGEDFKDAAIRELFEESGVTVEPEEVEKVGELTFYFPHNQGWDQIVHVFKAHQWHGEPSESDEMVPQWFTFDKIPFEKMWADDRHWLPEILSNKKVKATFSFKEDETIDKMEMGDL
jgi:8-oxo-dGTP diphosphatase